MLRHDADMRVRAVERGFEKDYLETAAVRENAASAVKLMRGTLKMLNDIFLNMQKDKVTATLQEL